MLTLAILAYRMQDRTSCVIVGSGFTIGAAIATNGMSCTPVVLGIAVFTGQRGAGVLSVSRVISSTTIATSSGNFGNLSLESVNPIRWIAIKFACVVNLNHVASTRGSSAVGITIEPSDSIFAGILIFSR